VEGDVTHHERSPVITMPIDFTVAIRTYNGEARIPEVLDRLLQQSNPEGIRWEVVVIDNNSSDRTAAIVADYAQRWRSDSQVRYLFEGRQGCGYARELAMREANSELVGFLDDDNLPDADWLIEAYRFGQAHPAAGAYGGNVHPTVDGPLPDNFHTIRFLLAVSDSGPAAFQYAKTLVHRNSPINPGCVIRKQAWKEAVPKQRRLWGRSEAWKLVATCAEDVEVMHYIINSHWEVWHNGAMNVQHRMPPRRLDPDYLRKIARTSGLSAHALRLSKLPPEQQWVMQLLTPAYAAVSALRVVGVYLCYRHRFSTDIVKACLFQRQLGMFLGCFVTPPPKSYDDVAAASPQNPALPATNG